MYLHEGTKKRSGLCCVDFKLVQMTSVSNVRSVRHSASLVCYFFICYLLWINSSTKMLIFVQLEHLEFLHHSVKSLGKLFSLQVPGAFYIVLRIISNILLLFFFPFWVFLHSLLGGLDWGTLDKSLEECCSSDLNVLKQDLKSVDGTEVYRMAPRCRDTPSHLRDHWEDGCISTFI